MKYSYYIGIDPDVDKCGIAVYDVEQNLITLHDRCPIDTMDFIESMHTIDQNMKVFIEASHKITNNWHLKQGEKPTTAAKKGYSVGRCHEVGILLCDYCRINNIQYEEVLPLRKIWGFHNDGKVSHEQLKHIIETRKIDIDTVHKNRSNQEQRDAALIVLTRSHN